MSQGKEHPAPREDFVTRPAFVGAMRGYDKRQVDEFVAQVEGQLNALMEERKRGFVQIQELARQLQKTQSELADLRQRPPQVEKASFRDLGPMVDQILALAEKQAETITTTATEQAGQRQAKADKVLIDARQQADELRAAGEAAREKAENEAARLSEENAALLAQARAEAAAATDAARAKLQEELDAARAQSQEALAQLKAAAEQEIVESRNETNQKNSALAAEAQHYATDLRRRAEEAAAMAQKQLEAVQQEIQARRQVASQLNTELGTAQQRLMQVRHEGSAAAQEFQQVQERLGLVTQELNNQLARLNDAKKAADSAEKHAKEVRARVQREAERVANLAAAAVMAAAARGHDTGEYAQVIIARPDGTPTSGQPYPNAPTSGQPLSSAPTSGQPLSSAPTSGQPVSSAPTSGQPFSAAPTSGQPLSAAPTSGQPYSAASASGQPFSSAPTSGQALSAAPTSGQPLSSASASGQPFSSAPTTGQALSSAPTSGQPLSSAPTSGQPFGEGLSPESAGGAGLNSGQAGGAGLGGGAGLPQRKPGGFEGGSAQGRGGFVPLQRGPVDSPPPAQSGLTQVPAPVGDIGFSSPGSGWAAGSGEHGLITPSQQRAEDNGWMSPGQRQAADAGWAARSLATQREGLPHRVDPAWNQNTAENALVAKEAAAQESLADGMAQLGEQAAQAEGTERETEQERAAQEAARLWRERLQQAEQEAANGRDRATREAADHWRAERERAARDAAAGHEALDRAAHVMAGGSSLTEALHEATAEHGVIGFAQPGTTQPDDLRTDAGTAEAGRYEAADHHGDPAGDEPWTTTSSHDAEHSGGEGDEHGEGLVDGGLEVSAAVEPSGAESREHDGAEIWAVAGEHGIAAAEERGDEPGAGDPGVGGEVRAAAGEEPGERSLFAPESRWASLDSAAAHVDDDSAARDEEAGEPGAQTLTDERAGEQAGEPDDEPEGDATHRDQAGRWYANGLGRRDLDGAVPAQRDAFTERAGAVID